MSHTPGPWSANGSDIMCDANYCVAVAYRARTDDDGNWMPSGEVDANARLIAAAPELLQRLRECVTWLEDHYDAASLDDDQSQHLDAARAAIAKAEGRSE